MRDDQIVCLGARSCVCFVYISPYATQAWPQQESINCARKASSTLKPLWLHAHTPGSPCCVEGPCWTKPQIAVIITADHTRIAPHMQAIKYLTSILSLSVLFALNMESIL